jgi:hypothetical protein
MGFTTTRQTAEHHDLHDEIMALPGTSVLRPSPSPMFPEGEHWALVSVSVNEDGEGATVWFDDSLTPDVIEAVKRTVRNHVRRTARRSKAQEAR